MALFLGTLGDIKEERGRRKSSKGGEDTELVPDVEDTEEMQLRKETFRRSSIAKHG